MRDPVRSSKGHFVKTSGLRWLSLMVVVPISRSGRHWALPFLSRSRPIGAVEREAPQAAQDADRLGAAGDPANQTLAAQPCPAIFVADSGFAALELLRLGALPRLCDHPAQAGCRLVQAGAAAPEGSAPTSRR